MQNFSIFSSPFLYESAVVSLPSACIQLTYHIAAIWQSSMSYCFYFLSSAQYGLRHFLLAQRFGIPGLFGYHSQPQRKQVRFLITGSFIIKLLDSFIDFFTRNQIHSTHH
jgi:hypothetical protein